MSSWVPPSALHKFFRKRDEWESGNSERHLRSNT